MEAKVYVLSGLGVDESVFTHIDCNPLSMQFIPWIIPSKNEPLQSYLTRLSEYIKEPNPTIIGLSFGGIIALELSKRYPNARIIQIASVKTHFEFPFYYSWLGKLKIHRFIPEIFLSRSNFIINWLFGVESKEEKRHLNDIFKRSNPQFRNWALDTLFVWSNTEIPENLISIHGTKDRLIPIRNVKFDFRVDKGGHFMTVNKAEKVNKVLREILLKPNKD